MERRHISGDHMQDHDSEENQKPSENSLARRALTLKERAKKARKDAYAKAKERQKAYLASPAVKAKIQAKKDQAKLLRQKRHDEQKAKKSAFTKNIRAQEKSEEILARENQQAIKDESLKKLLKPALTLLQGGNSSR